MGIIELPEKAAKLLKEIRKKYKVGFEPLSIGNYNIELLKVSDLELLLDGKDPFKNVSSFPFWGKLWDASLVLANVVVSLKPEPGQTLLELGAGLGAPGLLAASHGFSVTLSDAEPGIIDFQRVSAARNSLKGIKYSVINLKKLKKLTEFDVLIGSEVVSREDHFRPLLNAFDTYLAPGGTIFLAHDQRRKSLVKFMEMAADNYKVLGKKIDLSSEGEKQTIILNRLQKII